MQTKDFSITLDMMRTMPFRPFEVVEGDTGNILHVTLLNNGDAMDLSDCTIQIAFASSIGFAMQDETSCISKTSVTGTWQRFSWAMACRLTSSRGRPRTHLVRTAGGALVVVPCGNLNAMARP